MRLCLRKERNKEKKEGREGGKEIKTLKSIDCKWYPPCVCGAWWLMIISPEVGRWRWED